MRILVVSECFPPAWSWGGPPRSIWNMCRALVLAGCQVRVLTTDSDLGRALDLPAERQLEGVSVTTLRVPRGLGRRVYRYAFAPALGTALRRAAPAADLCVVQGVWTWPLLVAPRVCRARGLSYVICPRGTYEQVSLSEKAGRKRIYLRLVESRNIAHAAAVQFDTDGERANSLSVLGRTPGFVHWNGIAFAPAAARRPQELRARLGLAPDTILLGLAGRLHPRKGFEVIVPALAGASPHFHLLSFGTEEAGYRRVIEERARRSGVLARVHFLGPLASPELDEVYAALDLLVLPSLGESFGNVVIEALAQGTEVMVSDRVPLGAYVDSHALGTVVPSLEPSAWAAGLDRWRAQRATGTFDPAAAAAQVRRDFDLRDSGVRLLAAYRALAAARSA